MLAKRRAVHLTGSTANVSMRLHEPACRHQQLQGMSSDMAVNVKIPTTLRTFTGGLRSVEAMGSDLQELLTDLELKYPGLRARLVTQDGELRRFINIYINDNDIRYQGALGSALTDGDEVTIIPAVAGGA